MQDPHPQITSDDQVIPFHVDGLDIRGRCVQLGPMLNKILDGHQYPEPVSILLAQSIVLSILLGSSLKFKGRFTLQTQSDGPVSFLVVDYKTPGEIRAYARFDEAKISELSDAQRIDPAMLMGKGVLAMTIEQGANTQRYQGVVAIDGTSMEEIAHQYFRQSEQIPTKVRLAVARLIEPEGVHGSKTTWRAGGLIAQFLPDTPERMKQGDLPGGDLPHDIDVSDTLGSENVQPDDAWVEAASLVGTIADDELTDPQLTTNTLLYRLFHEHGVHVFEAMPVKNQCGCSQDKIMSILRGFSSDERDAAFAASEKPGFIISKCEYCGMVYECGEAGFSQKNQ